MRRTSTGHAYMEHRCGTRVTLSARALVTANTRETAMACVADASVTGAFVETTLRPPLLSRVTLRLRVGQHGALALDGYVVRQEDRGIAVEWLDPGSDEAAQLLSLAGQPSSPPRDLTTVPEATAAVSSL